MLEKHTKSSTAARSTRRRLGNTSHICYMSKLTYGHVLVVPSRRLVRPIADDDFVKSIHHANWRSTAMARGDSKRKETSKKLTLYYKEKYDGLVSQNEIPVKLASTKEDLNNWEANCHRKIDKTDAEHRW